MPRLSYYRCPVQIVVGKTLFYLPLYIIMAVYMYVSVNDMFALPRYGGFGTFLAFIMPYLLACIFLGITLSALVYRREDCIMLFVFLSVPLLFLSGVSWPLPSMPAFWKYVSRLCRNIGTASFSHCRIPPPVKPEIALLGVAY